VADLIGPECGGQDIVIFAAGARAAATNTPSLERVNAFSDGVFAIIITIMVLELKRPEEASLKAFVHMWPTWVSYIASYLFVAVVWVNHHYLLKKEIGASWRLIWANFAHMFVVSIRDGTGLLASAGELCYGRGLSFVISAPRYPWIHTSKAC